MAVKRLASVMKQSIINQLNLGRQWHSEISLISSENVPLLI